MKKWIVLLVSLLIMPSLPAISSGKENNIVAGPYIQNLGKDSVTIMWVTEKEAGVNRVYWGVNELKDVVEEDGGKIHEVTLSSLEENTSYIYAVESDGVKSKIYSFHTMPSEGSVSFIVYGDSRGVWDGWRNASMVARAMEGKADVVISTGDMIRSGKENEWLDFLSISTFMHNASLYPCLGNHDLPFETFEKYFSLPGNERWYSFDYGCAHFTVIDVCSTNTFSIPQILWLLTDLNSNAAWKFVIFHYPPYSSGEHGSTKILRLLTPLFAIKGVDIVFNGHDHDYEHVEAGGVTFIVTGGGGAPLYNVGSNPWTVFSESCYHYCMLETNPHHLHFSAITPDGEVIDEFEREK